MRFKLSKGDVNGKYYLNNKGYVFGPYSKKDALKYINKDSILSFDQKKWIKAKDIDDFHDVWPPEQKASLTPPATPKASSQITPVPPVRNSSVNPAFILVPVFLLICGIVGYIFWYKPYARDRDAIRMFSYAETLVFRSSPVPGVNYNVIGSIPYGAEIIVYAFNGEWANCKYDGKEGMVSTKFLLDGRDFHLLNGILTDAQTREAIGTTKCRKALLDYFKNRNMMSKVDPQIQQLYFGDEVSGDVWQVSTKPKQVKPNTVAYFRVMNPRSKFTDFACIVSNTTRNERKIVLFTFDEMETATLVFENPAPVNGDIESIVRMRTEYTDRFQVKYAF